jgi:hypothetical protein
MIGRLTFTLPKTFTIGNVSVIDFFFIVPLCKCKNIYLNSNRVNVNVKKFGKININHLHLPYFTQRIYVYLHLPSQHWL